MTYRSSFALALALVSLVACASSSTLPSGGSSSGSSGSETSSGDPAKDDDTADAGTTTKPTTAPFTESEVQALFDAKCARCHGRGSPNLDLSAPFTKNTVGVPAGGPNKTTTCGRGTRYTMRIAPGRREDSLLWHKVKGTQDCGNKMPFETGDRPLDATELERLGLYIDTLPR